MEYKCKLRVILAEREIKHGDFADKINVSRTTMSNIINEKTLPVFDVVYRICEELDLDIRDIWVRIK